MLIFHPAIAGSISALMRFCVQPRLFHLLRSTLPELVGDAVAPVDATSVTSQFLLAGESCPYVVEVWEWGAAHLGSWALRPVLDRLTSLRSHLPRRLEHVRKSRHEPIGVRGG